NEFPGTVELSALPAATRAALQNAGGTTPDGETTPGLPQRNDVQGIVANSPICADEAGPQGDELQFFDLPEIQLAPGREITLSGDTSIREDWLRVSASSSACEDAGGTPDALYALSVTEPTVIYADAFGPGTDFDAMVFLYKVDLPQSAFEDWEFVGCQDDSHCGLIGGRHFLQPQFTTWIDSGFYVLGVTGFSIT